MLNPNTIYLINGGVTLLILLGLQYWLNKNRYKKRARKRSMFADTTVVVGGAAAPPIDSIYTCPICLQTLTDACEALPCGHTFCASCAVNHWNSTGQSNRMLCPVDQKRIDFFVPDYTLRQYCTVIKSRLGSRNFGLDLNNEYELDAYNTKFFKQSSDWFGLNFKLLTRLHYDLKFVDLKLKLCYYLALMSVFIYILIPFDIIPEGQYGLYFFIGLIDDALISFFVFNLLGSLYKYHILKNGLDMS
eukprot:TRINITY_DN11287_c0_g1_i1.p1 TRINITY_DN11287_c0_g1~~TRINITY_DN11287_c0_g1_i1.p1  ORF type:complete len:246 (+),score=3.49 TRINITY_DN11287_c0_g1_i1:166-903(+)